jgi:serine/threonine protein kinase
MSKSEETTHLSPGVRSHSSPSDASTGRFPPGTVLDDRYRIVGLIGRGGMGEVYRADDLRLGVPVALKFLPEELSRDASRLELFHNEVRAARQVSHPNICRVYDIGGREGQLYLSMEFVDGEDLAASLRRFGRLPEDKALDIARQLCAGLMAAHERGVLHRDLKPANVMIDGEGRVRIMDFSLASVGVPEATRAGTPRYMAPEQFKGKPATAASDIFALGLVLYEIFTGRRAFTAKTTADLRRAALVECAAAHRVRAGHRPDDRAHGAHMPAGRSGGAAAVGVCRGGVAAWRGHAGRGDCLGPDAVA